MALRSSIPEPPLPDRCGVAFKEWAGVCHALEAGRQSLLLRKGGIAEGPGGFRPEHPAFWLFPTRFHEPNHGLKAGESPPPRDAPEGSIDLGALAVVNSLAWVDRWESLVLLDEFHVWTEETLRKKYDYRVPGLWVLGVRAYRRVEPARIAVSPEQAGCKTWVRLDEPIASEGLSPVLDRDEADRRRSALESLCGIGMGTSNG